LHIRLAVNLKACGPYALITIVVLLLGNVAMQIAQNKSYAQDNTTTILNDVRSALQNDRADLAEVRNMTTRELAVLEEINLTSTKLATQGAYTALSVFFLGIALVIFGLRLTTRNITNLGRYFTMMIWALTLPVMVLISIFQIGLVTNSPIRLTETEEPFFVLSFLMYIPIGIILFLLLQQKRITYSLAATNGQDKTANNTLQELEKILLLKEKGLFTDEEFQKAKASLLAKL
jgi:hypothetical protein